MNAFHWTKSREEMELILLNLDLPPPPPPLDLARDGQIWERGGEREREEAVGLFCSGEQRQGGEGKSWPGFKSQVTAPC